MAKKTTGKKSKSWKTGQKAPTPAVVKKVESVVAANKKQVNKAKAQKKAAPKQQKKKRVDWSKAKTKYITDPTQTYLMIAKEYGVTENTVYAHAKKESWIALREKHVLDTETNALTKLGGDRTDQLVKLQVKHYTLLDKLSDKISDALDRLARDEWEPKNIEALAKASKIVVEAERLTLGLPSTVTGLSDPRGDKLTVTIESLHQKAREVIEGEVVNEPAA